MKRKDRIPNELSYNEATCSQYYDSNLYSSAEGFPAYIYPTQSSELIQEQRVEAYIKIMESCNNSPRGLAYYEEGFVCALLDGHHKACAASVLGKMLNCLTIIAADRFLFQDGAKYADGDTLIKSVGFAGIINAEVDIKGDVVEYAKQLILSLDEEEVIKLDYLLVFLSGYRKEEAYTIAKLTQA